MRHRHNFLIFMSKYGIILDQEVLLLGIESWIVFSPFQKNWNAIQQEHPSSRTSLLKQILANTAGGVALWTQNRLCFFFTDFVCVIGRCRRAEFSCFPASAQRDEQNIYFFATGQIQAEPFYRCTEQEWDKKFCSVIYKIGGSLSLTRSSNTSDICTKTTFLVPSNEMNCLFSVNIKMYPFFAVSNDFVRKDVPLFWFKACLKCYFLVRNRHSWRINYSVVLNFSEYIEMSYTSV